MSGVASRVEAGERDGIRGWGLRRGGVTGCQLSSWWLAAMIGFSSGVWASDSPQAVEISNAGFEQPVLRERGAARTFAGWKVHSADFDRVEVIRDDREGVNRAKDGRQWLVLEAGAAVGQRLGKIDEFSSTLKDMDRLFVEFVLSTLQQPGDINEVRLSVELYASSANHWEEGARVSSKEIVDLTNDERGDLNSYLDSYAVLKCDRESFSLAGGEYLWLVLRNAVERESHRAPLLVDRVAANWAAKPTSPKLPNILIVFQDDMGYGDTTSFNSQSKIQTPHLDRLAQQGMRFTDAHTAATICGPSRIGLLTGTMPSKLGVRGNFAVGGNERFGPSTLPPGTPTIATMCRAEGYDTAVVGKWGIPSDWDARRKEGIEKSVDRENAASIVDFRKPLSNAEMFGFEYRYLFDENRPFVRGETEPFEENAEPFGWHENGFAVRDVLTHTQDKLHEFYLRAITDRAIRYFQTKAGLRRTVEGDFRIRDRAAPFYLHYLTHAPHLPIVPALQFRGMSQVGGYGDFVIDLDYSLGRLMGALDECEMAHHTLVIFSADNGPENTAYDRAAQEGHFSMGPWRGVKRDLYEGGHRVPLVVRWPAVVRPRSVSAALVNLSDWYATIAEVIGHKPSDESGLDSMSILPILKNQAKEVRGLMLQDSCVNGIARAIRVGSWKYIDRESGELNRKKEPEWFRQLRHVVDVPGNELFHLADDPSESRNRIADVPDRVGEIKALFDSRWPDNVRSTPPFAQQIDSDQDGYSDFYEQILGKPQ